MEICSGDGRAPAGEGPRVLRPGQGGPGVQRGESAGRPDLSGGEGAIPQAEGPGGRAGGEGVPAPAAELVVQETPEPGKKKKHRSPLGVVVVWPKGEKRRGHSLQELLSRLYRVLVDNELEVWRRDEPVTSLPLLILLILFVFAFYVTIPLLLIGLFFEFRYRFSGPELERDSINDVMENVASTAADMGRQVMDELHLQYEADPGPGRQGIDLRGSAPDVEVREDMEEKILLVEDEEKLARMVELGCGMRAIGWTRASTAAPAGAGPVGEYDLVLLDIMLPQLSGMEVLRRLRKEGVQLPSSCSPPGQRGGQVSGLDSGADDYITKPRHRGAAGPHPGGLRKRGSGERPGGAAAVRRSP